MTNVYQQEYLGGVDPFVQPMDPNFSKTQFVAEGFEFGAEGVVTEVLLNGATTYKPVVITEPSNVVRFIDTIISSIRVSGLNAVDPESAYLITTNQFK